MFMAAAAVSAVGAIQQGQANKAAASYNAQLAERDATISRQQASMDAETQRRDSQQTLGAMRAAYGASGVTMEGSPLDVLEASAEAAERDRQTLLYKGELRAMGYESDAAGQRYRGKQAETASYYSAGSSILMGAARAGKARGFGAPGDTDV
jgi:hypothetical protein